MPWPVKTGRMVCLIHFKNLNGVKRIQMHSADSKLAIKFWQEHEFKIPLRWVSPVIARINVTSAVEDIQFMLDISWV